MPKEQTEKSRYPSRYSPGGFVTAAQYIIELACERQAQYLKKDLPIKFWNLPEWRFTFIKQLRRAHSLLKKYPEKAIIRAITNNNIRSLLVPWLEEKIEAEKRILEVEKEKIVVTPVKREENVTFREKKVVKNALSKLMDLDN